MLLSRFSSGTTAVGFRRLSEWLSRELMIRLGKLTPLMSFDVPDVEEGDPTCEVCGWALSIGANETFIGVVDDDWLID